jgi:hypothetical protein
MRGRRSCSGRMRGYGARRAVIAGLCPQIIPIQRRSLKPAWYPVSANSLGINCELQYEFTFANNNITGSKAVQAA